MNVLHICSPSTDQVETQSPFGLTVLIRGNESGVRLFCEGREMVYRCCVALFAILNCTLQSNCVSWTVLFAYKVTVALPPFTLFPHPFGPSLTHLYLLLPSPHTMVETVDKATLDKQAINVLNCSMWSKKQYYILLGALLIQSFIYAFETNLMYGVIVHVTTVFTSSSLTAILPTILQILSASLVPF